MFTHPELEILADITYAVLTFVGGFIAGWLIWKGGNIRMQSEINCQRNRLRAQRQLIDKMMQEVVDYRQALELKDQQPEINHDSKPQGGGLVVVFPEEYYGNSRLLYKDGQLIDTHKTEARDQKLTTVKASISYDDDAGGIVTDGFLVARVNQDKK